MPRPDLFPDGIDGLDPGEPAGQDTICIRDGVADHKLALALRQPTVDRSEPLLALCQISVTLRTLGRKLLDLLAILGFFGPPPVFLAVRLQDVVARSELQQEDPV